MAHASTDGLDVAALFLPLAPLSCSIDAIA